MTEPTRDALHADVRFTIDDPRVSPCPTTGCWLWTLPSYVKHGHNSIHFRGKTTGVHRVYYTLHKGEIPEGLVIDHICRVPACVNPDHLRAVTTYVNNTENSVGWAAVNVRQTHCPKCGGEYSSRWHTRHQQYFRYCKPCNTEGNRIRRKIKLDGLFGAMQDVVVLLEAGMTTQAMDRARGAITSFRRASAVTAIREAGKK